MVFLPVLAEKPAQDVGKFTLPEGHLFGMVVPKGGSACSKCKFLSQDGSHCGSDYFQSWRKSLSVKDPAEIPAAADEYCCDVFAEAPTTEKVARRFLGYIKKEHGEYCVHSESNPDWNGGCYSSKEKAQERLKQVEYFKHKGASDLVARVLARFFTAGAMLDEKMKVLLLKLRKGADSSLSIPQFFKVIDLLGGWRHEPIVGLIPIHYPKGEVEKELLQHIHDHDEAAARAFYDKVKSYEVSSLPANPQLGQFYVMDLAPFKSWEDAWDKTKMVHGAAYKLWVGVPGYRITDPNGKVFELLPSRHDLDSRGMDALPTVDVKALSKRLRPWDLLKWAKQHTTWLAQINEALGMDPHEKAAPRTRENTGTCGACLRNIKLVWKGDTLPTMSLHGYNRPGHGYIIGKCFGGALPPYELSPQATKIMLQAVQRSFDEAKELVDFLAGDPETFEYRKTTYKKSEEPDKWEYYLKQARVSAEYALQFPARDLKAYSWLVDHWEKRDLPKEGAKHIDWYLQALRSTGGKED